MLLVALLSFVDGIALGCLYMMWYKWVFAHQHIQRPHPLKKIGLVFVGRNLQRRIILRHCKWINCRTLRSPLENTVSLKTKFWLQSPTSSLQNGPGEIQTLQTQEIKWNRVWALTYFHCKRNKKMKAYGCLVLWNLSIETWRNAPILGREGDLFCYKALLNFFGYQEAGWVSRIHFFAPQQQWLFHPYIY